METIFLGLRVLMVFFMKPWYWSTLQVNINHVQYGNILSTVNLELRHSELISSYRVNNYMLSVISMSYAYWNQEPTRPYILKSSFQNR